MLTLFGEVCDRMASDVFKAVIQDGEKQIVLSTSGGDLTAALAIYDAIKDQGVTVIATGCVMSAGVVVLLGGQKRYATPNTRFMTHPIVCVYEDENEKPCAEDIAETDAVSQAVALLMAERTGLPESTTKAMLGSTNYFGVEEALAMKFIDKEWRWK